MNVSNKVELNLSLHCKLISKCITLYWSLVCCRPKLAFSSSNVTKLILVNYLKNPQGEVSYCPLYNGAWSLTNFSGLWLGMVSYASDIGLAYNRRHRDYGQTKVWKNAVWPGGLIQGVLEATQQRCWSRVGLRINLARTTLVHFTRKRNLLHMRKVRLDWVEIE